MGHKEKAKEIVNNLRKEIYKGVITTTDVNPIREANRLDVSKRCALVMVEGIISALEITTGHCELRQLDYQEVISDFEYWKRVINSINEL